MVHGNGMAQTSIHHEPSSQHNHHPAVSRLPQVLPDSWADVQAVHAGDELAWKPRTIQRGKAASFSWVFTSYPLVNIQKHHGKSPCFMFLGRGLDLQCLSRSDGGHFPFSVPDGS